MFLSCPVLTQQSQSKKPQRTSMMCVRKGWPRCHSSRHLITETEKLTQNQKFGLQYFCLIQCYEFSKNVYVIMLLHRRMCVKECVQIVVVVEPMWETRLSVENLCGRPDSQSPQLSFLSHNNLSPAHFEETHFF